jgi:hypothetical protein
MREDPRARAMLSEIAASGAPLRNYQKVGDFMTAEELANMAGRGIRAAGVTLPSEPITGQGLGIRPTPQPALTLIDLFPAFPQTERIVSWMQRSGIVVAAAPFPCLTRPRNSRLFLRPPRGGRRFEPNGCVCPAGHA